MVSGKGGCERTRFWNATPPVLEQAEMLPAGWGGVTPGRLGTRPAVKLSND